MKDKLYESKLCIKTPLVYSDRLSHITGKNVYLKIEALQPSGSFKNRGIGLFCLDSVRRGTQKFVSSSGGNAGLAAAYSARILGKPITVVIPKSTPHYMKERIEFEGAEVIQKGEDWQEANEYAKSLCVPNQVTFVHPFDHHLTWQGHETLIDEVVADNFKPDAVVLSVGGGGLFSGVVQGLKNAGLNETHVFAVETKGAASLRAALEAGRVLQLPLIKTIATSLGARAVSQQALKLALEHPVHSELVTDAQAVRACCQFAEDHHILVEPACGASLALCYDLKEKFQDHKNILVVVCGGSCTNLTLFSNWILN